MKLHSLGFQQQGVGWGGIKVKLHAVDKCEEVISFISRLLQIEFSVQKKSLHSISIARMLEVTVLKN